MGKLWTENSKFIVYLLNYPNEKGVRRYKLMLLNSLEHKRIQNFFNRTSHSYQIVKHYPNLDEYKENEPLEHNN